MFNRFLIISGAIALVSCQVTSPDTPPIASPATSAQATTSPVAKEEPSSFDESMYLFANPDVKELLKQKKYKSGLEHYQKVGQNTKKPDGKSYESFFTGTDGNDTVRSFGQEEGIHLAGIGFEIVAKEGDPLPLRPKSIGQGEVDVLIGSGKGENEFLLGSFITSVNPKAEPFYVGKGDADYARIQNFTKSKDAIILAGDPKQYKFEPAGKDLRISTATGDLVAIVEGVDKLEVGEVVKEFGMFTIK